MARVGGEGGAAPPGDLDRLSRDLDWNLLRTFMTVVQEGGVTAAAARLFVTQPAVSLALKRLEDRLGRRLIERGGGKFRVTEVGDAIYREILEIYGTISRLGVLIRDVPEEISGHIRILMVSRVETRLLDQALEDFHTLYPLVTFRTDVMSSAEVHMALQQKIGTLGICLLREPVPGLKSEILIHQTYRLYCGPTHRFFGQSGLKVADLRHENFVSFLSDQMGGVLSPLAVFRAREGFAGRIVGSSSNLDELRRMIVCGLGIGPLPQHIAAAAVAGGQLWDLPPYGGVAPVDIHLAWNTAAKFSRAETLFIRHLLAKVEGVPTAQRLP
jgi:DNA-binding transcriptional LysR family regulator